MDKSEDIKELLSALAKAQEFIKVAIKDKVNPHFKSKFADLESVQAATKDALVKHGLFPIQLIEDEYYLRTIIGHSSGQWISSRFKLLINKQDMQGLGSAITYARRYGLAAILNVASDDDDDGNAAVSKPSTKPPPSPFPDEWPEHGPPVQTKPRPVNHAPGSRNEPNPQKSEFANPPEQIGTVSLTEIIEDLHAQLEAWKFPAGVNAGRTLLDIGYRNSKKYAEWVLEQERSGNNVIDYQRKAVEMMDVFSAYLRAKEENVDEIPF